jgi:hypothetical protein
MNRTEAQALYELGREEAYVSMRERQGYGGAVGGLGRVLCEANPLRAEWRGGMIASLLASRYHNTFVWFHDRADTLKIEAAAQHVDLSFATQFRGKLDYTLQCVLDGDNRAINIDAYRSPPNVAWIERQVAAELKGRKIRRGSKRHDTFTATFAQKMLDTVTNMIRRNVEEERERVAWRVRELWRTIVEPLDRVAIRTREAVEIIRTLWEAAELPGMASSIPIGVALARHLDETRERIASTLEAACNKKFADCALLAVEALAASEELRPFAVHLVRVKEQT